MCLPYQDGKTLENPYKKGGKELPPAIAPKGKKGIWDFSEMEEALRNLVIAFNEKCKDKKESSKPVEKAQDVENLNQPPVDKDDNDDLPF